MSWPAWPRASGASDTWVETRSPRHLVAWINQCQVSFQASKTKLSCWINDQAELEGPNVRLTAQLAERLGNQKEMLTVRIRTQATLEMAKQEAQSGEPPTIRDVRPTHTQQGKIIPVWHHWTPEPKLTASHQHGVQYTYEATTAIMLNSAPVTAGLVIDTVSTLLQAMNEPDEKPNQEATAPSIRTP